MNKVPITQDFLYSYLREHDVNIKHIAELMGKSFSLVYSSFHHNKDVMGVPRNFTANALPKLNEALVALSEELKQSVIIFGSEKTFTNTRGIAYDPGALNAVKNLSKFFNLNAFTARVLGWSISKKESTLSSPSSKIYGYISEEHVSKINTEILAIAGTLGGVEVLLSQNIS